MMDTVLQNVVSSGVLLLIIWFEATHLLHVLAQTIRRASSLVGRGVAVLRLTVHGALTSLAMMLLLDPFVAGTAHLVVDVPPNVLTTSANLRVRAEPTGNRPEEGAFSTVIRAYDDAGVVELDVPLGPFETHVRLSVYDITRSDVDVVSKTVSVSPLVRRQLSKLRVNWDH